MQIAPRTPTAKNPPERSPATSGWTRSPSRAGHESPPRRAFGRPRRARTGRGGELVAHPAVGLATSVRDGARSASSTAAKISCRAAASRGAVVTAGPSSPATSRSGPSGRGVLSGSHMPHSTAPAVARRTPAAGRSCRCPASPATSTTEPGPRRRAGRGCAAPRGDGRAPAGAPAECRSAPLTRDRAIRSPEFVFESPARGVHATRFGQWTWRSWPAQYGSRSLYF
jgi:hypothetical protein